MISEETCRELLAQLAKPRYGSAAIADVQPGLTAQEFAHAERLIGARFPPDLRLLLSIGLPVGECFPNWRDLDSPYLLDRLMWPHDGIRFDIEHNVFWLPSWGARPADLEEALAVATDALKHVPVLIPVYAHRYLPAEPCLAGNPVISAYQTDIIYYGRDLAAYFTNEFFSPAREWVDSPYTVYRRIRFWSYIIEDWPEIVMANANS
jgi:hypothetical protein